MFLRPSHAIFFAVKLIQLFNLSITSLRDMWNSVENSGKSTFYFIRNSPEILSLHCLIQKSQSTVLPVTIAILNLAFQ